MILTRNKKLWSSKYPTSAPLSIASTYREPLQVHSDSEPRSALADLSGYCPYSAAGINSRLADLD